MKTSVKTTFLLNNSLAAVSVSVIENAIVATDGLTSNLHFFDSCGNFQRYENTIRPYRRLRRSVGGTFYTAIGNCQTARVYFLDCNFNEFCSVELETENGFCQNGFGELIDVSTTTIGNETFLIGAFSNSAFLFDMNGKRLQKLCAAERGEILTDFISFGIESYAMSTLRNKTRTIAVSENGVMRSSILSRNYNLRMLFSDGNDELFGLFGKNYIYNKIIKIYSQSNLILPETNTCV